MYMLLIEFLGEIDELTRQMSEEACVNDDENDASVEMDDELLSEFSDLLGELGIPDTTSDQRPKQPQIPSQTRDLDNNTYNSKPLLGQKTVAAPSSGLSLLRELQERLENYTRAKEAVDAMNDASKLRRFDRAINVWV